MTYVVVINRSIKEFCESIERNLASGWELQGGVSVIMKNSVEIRYHQAMVKLI